ncbi:alpha/beta hydrolase [Metabacillus idriensis]|uniref:alpha/beta hydrolase n=1 Tax=Metabacillus idriensis TaxID=324768 RepID=UPI001749717E|nr:alpha/beta fold hydrolase [Metabacillus idriensis]
MSKTIFPVLPGAESFFHKGNEIGILLCHGFVGTPQSVGELGKLLADKGFTVLAPRLKGHGTHAEELETCCYLDWFEDLEKAYLKLKKVCKNVFIAGQSMGGTLAVQLAGKHKEISGVITINAALDVPGYEFYRDKTEPRFIPEGKPDIKAEGIEEITYSAVPITAVKKLLGLITFTKSKIADVECPILIFKSEEDHVVPPESSDFLFESVSSPMKQIISLTNSYHVASMDYDKEIIANQTADYIRMCCHPEIEIPVSR